MVWLQINKMLSFFQVFQERSSSGEPSRGGRSTWLLRLIYDSGGELVILSGSKIVSGKDGLIQIMTQYHDRTLSRGQDRYLQFCRKQFFSAQPKGQLQREDFEGQAWERGVGRGGPESGVVNQNSLFQKQVLGYYNYCEANYSGGNGKNQSMQDPNYYNFMFSYFNFPFPNYMFIEPALPYPFTAPFQESPSLLVKTQADHLDVPIKTKETLGDTPRASSSCRDQGQSAKQDPIRENIISEKYSDFNKNVLPNNIHLVLSYIRRTNKSGAIVDKIIGRLGNDQHLYSKKKFYSYQAYVKEKLASIKYNNMIEGVISHIDATSTVFSLQEQMFYNKITRTLILNFLREGALINVLSSSKITKTKKDQHLKIQRIIIQKIQALR